MMCASACAAPDDDVAGSTAAILNADGNDDTASPLYPGVVLIRDVFLGEESRCTGTLVSPSHVLTAAHCGASKWSPDRLRGITIIFGANQFTTPYRGTRNVMECQVHPDWDFGPGPGRPCGEAPEGMSFTPGTPHDLIVLTLSGPVPPEWADLPPSFPASTLRQTWHALPDASLTGNDLLGEDATLVGYGSLTEASGGTASGIRHFVTLEVTELAFPPEPPPPSTPFLPWGEPFLGVEDAFVDGGSVPTGYRGMGSGDSGGPLLYSSTGPAHLLDVVVGVAAGQNWYVDITRPINRNWIESALDLNSDGKFDVYCDGVRSTTVGLDPLSSPVNDPDGDGIVFGDNCPGLWNPCQRDREEDGVGDACDACPFDFGTSPDPTDTDGDGIRDGCDSCPLFAGPQTDSDGDLIGDDCDNCEFEYNPNQANCNADAEIAAGILSLDPAAGVPGDGDACDPLPCGETRVESRVIGDGTIRRLNDGHLRVDGLGFVPGTRAPRAETTGFRYCPCASIASDDIAARRQCELTDGCDVLSSQYGVEPADYSLPGWREVTTSSTGLDIDAIQGDEIDDVVFEAPVDRGPLRVQTDAATQWMIALDAARWSPPALNGMVWTHAPDSSVPVSERDLRSHYWGGQPHQPIPLYPPIPCLRHAGPLVHFGACESCSRSFPAPYLSLSALVDKCGDASDTALLYPDGWRVPYLDMLPLLKVTDPVELLTPAEHWTRLDTTSLRYVSVVGTGTQVSPITRVDEVGGVLSQTALSFSGAEDVSAGPPILIASTGRLVHPGTKLDYLRTANVGDTMFDDFALSQSVGAILAMGYDLDRGVIIVLSAPGYSRTSSGAGGASHFRLLAIDVNGSVEQWALIPRNVPGNGNDLRYAIATSPSGGIVVVRSGDSSNGTNVVHLMVTPHGIRADGAHLTSHDMPAGLPPIADETGVSLVAFDGPPPAQTLGVRYEEMEPIAIEELGDFL